MLFIMNTKNNQINQIQKELDEIKVNAKTLNLNDQIKDDLNTIVLTEIVDSSDDSNKLLSNSEIIIKLKQLQDSIKNQQDILTHLIENLDKKNN